MYILYSTSAKRLGLLLDVANCYLILFPQLVDIGILAKDVLDGSIERPGNYIKSTLVELTYEVGVIVVAQPHQEVAGSSVTIHIAATFGTVSLAIEAAVNNAHSIGHSLDECPEHSVRTVCANALRLQLVSVCQFVQQHTASLEKHLGSVVVCKGFCNIFGAVIDENIENEIVITVIATGFNKWTLDDVTASKFVEEAKNNTFETTNYGKPQTRMNNYNNDWDIPPFLRNRE